MGFIKEFKEFATKGNVIDLAVGVIIGTAFGKIVKSFVDDIIMPMVNPLIAGGDWRAWEVGNGIKLGSFIGAVIDFLIMAFAIFVVIKVINRYKKTQEAAPAPPTKEEVLLTEIRDILKEKR